MTDHPDNPALDRVSLSYGGLTVFSGLSAEFPAGEITAVLGPSGCGKTTLLNLLSGTLKPDQGMVTGCGKSRFSYLFQDVRLLPWKTVRGNLDFILHGRFPGKKREEVVNRYLDLVKLSGFSNWYPGMLSGGMKQRAAMARAFSFPADILLMDEPFQSLDLVLKLELVRAFTRLWLEEPKTAVLVTHDIREAVLLGTQVLVLGPLGKGIVEKMVISQPLSERNLESPELLRAEGRLYHALLQHS